MFSSLLPEQGEPFPLERDLTPPAYTWCPARPGGQQCCRGLQPKDGCGFQPGRAMAAHTRPHSSFPPPLRSAAAVSQRSRTRRRLTPSRPSPRARAGTAHALQDPPAEAGKHRDGRDFSRRPAGVLSALAEFTSFPQSSPAAEREEKHTPGTFKLHYECVVESLPLPAAHSRPPHSAATVSGLATSAGQEGRAAARCVRLPLSRSTGMCSGWGCVPV